MNGRLLAAVAAAAFCLTFSTTLTSSHADQQAGGQQTPARGSTGRATGVPSGNDGAEPCAVSPICAWGRGRNLISHEVRKPDLAFTYAYPFAMPDGLTGGVSAVALNSKEHLYAFQRNPGGKPQLFEFDQNHKLVR